MPATRPVFTSSCSRRYTRALTAAVAAAVALAVALALAIDAPAQDPQAELDAAEEELSETRERQGILTTEIEEFSTEIEQLSGELSLLRNREAMVEAQLEETQELLDAEHDALLALRERLRRSLNVLSDRLVEIYKADEPDMLTVLLESDGFADLLERFEYLQRIEQADSVIVDRVRSLRNETEGTVLQIRAERDAIAAKKAELQRTRVALQQREAELEAARSERQELLGNIDGHIERLEGDIGDLEEEVQQQLSESTTAPALPAGPIEAGSGDMIWPVNGTLTSPFGQRWGRLHAGIDIAAPGGMPIRAAKAGSVAMAGPNGGYGNYTCINHGGAQSTCYAHQSSIGVSVGQSVGQGDVIGAVGNTGASFGDHLHFEVRINGSPVDPMGYL